MFCEWVPSWTSSVLSFTSAYSLKKSERALTHKIPHKSSKHSEVKRAKRRIKDAEKTLKDIPKASGTESIYATVVEQVTHLCQRLMQIPMTLSIHGNKVESNSRTLSPSYNNESDETDTDNTDEDTNGAKPLERPRSNSDTRMESHFPANRALRYSPGLVKSKIKRNQLEKELKHLPGNFMDDYIDRFNAIGYIPNDSESSEGSLRSDSPGPLRGYPLSLQRRPSSAGRAERQSFTKDRSSSLPLLTIPFRRCHTPTPMSNGSSFTIADISPLNRNRYTNGGSGSINVFGRRDRLFTDTQRTSPLNKPFISKEKQNKQKFTSAQLYKKDEILTSYEREVENLVKRQGSINSPTERQSKHSNSDGSDSSKHKSELDTSFRDDQRAGLYKQEQSDTDRKGTDGEITDQVFETKQAVEQESSGSDAHYRLTPKRLLPKVPAQSLNNTKGSPVGKRDKHHFRADKVVREQNENHLQRANATDSPKCKPDSEKTVLSVNEIGLVTSHKTSPVNTEDAKGNKNIDVPVVKDKRKEICSFNEQTNEDAVTSKQQQTQVEQTDFNIEPDIKHKKLENKELDIEEIKFKENVRTARREIIDKLRSKYALPRREHESSPDITSIDSDSTNIFKQDTSNVIKCDQLQTSHEVENNKSHESDNTFPKSAFVSKHAPFNNSSERHSPVMSITGLKRYKSTTNLSKLESFDKATSKFDNKEMEDKMDKGDEAVHYDRNVNIPQEQKFESNQTYEFTEPPVVIDKLSKSLTFDNNRTNLSHIPLDRQGLLRSASVENVDSYQFLDSLSSSDQLSVSINNNLKESGISTLSSNELNLINVEDQTVADDPFSYNNNTTADESPKGVTSSSDNGFDSGEGLGNSEDSIDELELNSSSKINSLETTISKRSPKLYPAKLIHIDEPTRKSIISTPERVQNKNIKELPDISAETSPQSTDLLKSSNVRTAVEKLENTIFARSRPEKRTLKQFKENSVERKVHIRSRSASASRNPASVYGDILPTAAKALQPRSRLGSENDAISSKPQLPLLLFSVKKSRSIEADLNKICQEESAESIRREWINRRSASASRKQEIKLPTSHVMSIFEYDSSRLLPSRYLRRHLIGIISLQNGKIIIIDQLQMCLYLLNSELRVVSETTLDCLPCGMCVTGSNSFAVALPYKCIVRVFYVVKDRVTHTRDIKLGCNEWITDVNHRKGRLHILCKGGHIHILGITGREEITINIGMTGKLQLNEAGNRFYVHGERQITRFNDKGEIIWTKSDVNASCMLLFNDKLYITDNGKEKILTLSEIGDTRDLVSKDVGCVSAACLSHNSDKLYICRYADELDDESTRRVTIYRKRAK